MRRKQTRRRNPKPRNRRTRTKETQSSDAHVLPTLRTRIPAQQKRRTTPRQAAPVVTAPLPELVSVAPVRAGEINRDLNSEQFGF